MTPSAEHFAQNNVSQRNPSPGEADGAATVDPAAFGERPQLLNVVAGRMSLVGRRPRALALDQEFDRKIALYARRHNAKAGMTD